MKKIERIDWSKVSMSDMKEAIIGLTIDVSARKNDYEYRHILVDPEIRKSGHIFMGDRYYTKILFDAVCAYGYDDVNAYIMSQIKELMAKEAAEKEAAEKEAADKLMQEIEKQVTNEGEKNV